MSYGRPLVALLAFLFAVWTSPSAKASCDGGNYPSTASFQTSGMGAGYGIWAGVSMGVGPVSTLNPCQDFFSGGYGLEGLPGGDFQVVKYNVQTQQCTGGSIYGMPNACQRWHTNTGGHTGARMFMGGSVCGTGVLCVYDVNNNNVILWSYDSGDRAVGTWLELDDAGELRILDGSDNRVVATIYNGL